MFSLSKTRFAPLIVAGVFLSACQQAGNTPIAASSHSYSMMASTSVFPHCQHQDSPYSSWVCPDTTLSDLFLPADVAAETLVVHTTAGKTIRLTMPSRVDAIFLSESAVETFLLRHYDATDTTKARLLREFIAAHTH
jgi:hypothetical protein